MYLVNVFNKFVCSDLLKVEEIYKDVFEISWSSLKSVNCVKTTNPIYEIQTNQQLN